MSEFSGFISKEILHVRSKKKSPILSIKCLPLQRIVLSGLLPQKLSHESHKFRHITGKWMFSNYEKWTALQLRKLFRQFKGGKRKIRIILIV